MNVARRSIATTNGQKIAVIGAGVGGLAAAVAFAMRGYNVTVFEQSSVLGDVGAGLQISPNGARVLSALEIGVGGISAKAVVPTDGLSGRTITRFDVSAKTPPYRFIYRPSFIASFEKRCIELGIEIRLGEKQTGVPEGYDLVVGADGLHSFIRADINGASEPFFTGQTAWRAIVTTKSPPEARIWMMPGAHVVTYPLDENRLNIVAVQERSKWTAEGWHHPDTSENLKAAFSNACNELRDILELATDINLWGLFRHPVAPLWHKENKVLVGDAAHPTLPFLAQGANLALEDAYVLAKCCDQHGLQSGVRRYAQLRTPRVTRAIAVANANARNYHLRGLQRSMSFAALQAIGAIAPNAFLNRLSWLYDHDVTA